MDMIKFQKVNDLKFFDFEINKKTHYKIMKDMSEDIKNGKAIRHNV